MRSQLDRRYHSLTRPLVVSCAVVLVIAAAVLPVRDVRIGYGPAFFAIYYLLLGGSEALIGGVLLVWSQMHERSRLRWLGATYLCTALLVTADMIFVALLAAKAQVPAMHQGPFWIALLWDIGWLVGVLVATYQRRRRPPTWVPLILGGCAIIAATVAFSLSPLAANIALVDASGRFTSVHRALSGLAVLLGVTLIVRLVRISERYEIDRWLLIAAVALVGSTEMTAVSDVSFSVGTYVSRTLGAISGFVVLVGVLRSFMRSVRWSDEMERYAAIIDALPVIAFVSDGNLRCKYVNRHWVEHTGQPREAALEAGWQAFIHPDDLQRIPQVGAESENEPAASELRLRDRAGHYQIHQVRYARFPGTGARDAPWVRIGSLVNIDNERRLVAESEAKSAELRQLAHALQSVFLPSYLPVVDGLAIEAVYRPAAGARDVGGDWYDAFVLPSGVLAFTIGDVAGHGLGAATAMVRVREMVRTTAVSAGSSPSQALMMANLVLATSHDIIASAIVAYYDPRAGTMVVASAGHPAPAVIRGGVARLAAPTGILLGVMDGAAYRDTEIVLEAGDRIAFYTDGIIEANRAAVEGERRLLDALERPPAAPLDLLVDGLFDGEQSDDATLVLATYTGRRTSASWHFEADDAGSAQHARSAFCKHLALRGLPADVISRTELVFGELVSNVVRHAPGPIEIELTFGDERATLAVRDRGGGFVSAGDELPLDPYTESGRGLFLVHTFAGTAPVIRGRLGGGSEVSVQMVLGEEIGATTETALTVRTRIKATP